jgi:D-inositol-3-phosphate glycosyltransferase
VDTLLRAMAILQERHPAAIKGTCLAIIGGDPWNEDRDSEMARLQQLRHELGIHDLVTFLGARDQEILPYYYAAANVVVMPSHYESFGMVALEAMAMGTPVIASEVGGLAHLVQHGVNGFHVPSRDPEALAARLLDLLTDDGLRTRLGEQARAYTQRYHWSAIVNRMLDVYAEVVG